MADKSYTYAEFIETFLPAFKNCQVCGKPLPRPYVRRHCNNGRCEREWHIQRINQIDFTRTTDK